MRKHLLLSLFLSSVILWVGGVMVGVHSGYPGHPDWWLAVSFLMLVGALICGCLWGLLMLAKLVAYAVRSSGAGVEATLKRKSDAGNLAEMPDKRASAGHRFLG